MATKMKYAKTFVALNQMGKNVVRMSRKNLDEKTTKITSSGRRLTSKINNTGSLSKSIRADVLKDNLVFQMAEYGLYIDTGRKKGKFAPVDAIKQWIKTKRIKPRDAKGRFMKQTTANMDSLAFLLNRAIYKHGIKPTLFFTNPLESEMKKLERKLPKAIETDIDTFFNRPV